MTARILFLIAALFSFHSNAADFHPLHIDLGATGETYRRALMVEMQKNPRLFMATRNSDIEYAIDLGEVLWQWIDKINAARPVAEQLRLYTPENMMAIPIDNPKKYSPTLVKQTTQEILAQLPKEMADVLTGASPIPATTAGIPDDVFAEWARKVDKNYQTGTRWKLVSPNIFYYRMRKTDDVRGYYFLTRIRGIEARLASWNARTVADQQKYRVWLTNLCENGGGKTCANMLATAVRNNKVAHYYRAHFPRAKQKWDKFFGIGGRRSDVVWNSSNPNVATVPFRKASVSEDAWMKHNIEDEWQFGSWALKLNFSNTAAIHVVWEPGVVPNVNGLGGNRITMDSTSSMDEWDVQWTIRHEFGHSLGLPDCYVEFYDDNEQAMVNYQLDTTNLMCSRRGELQQIHVDELKKAYYRP